MRSASNGSHTRTHLGECVGAGFRLRDCNCVHSFPGVQGSLSSWQIAPGWQRSKLAKPHSEGAEL
jgi:hypothetical protein